MARMLKLVSFTRYAPTRRGPQALPSTLERFDRGRREVEASLHILKHTQACRGDRERERDVSPVGLARLYSPKFYKTYGISKAISLTHRERESYYYFLESERERERECCILSSPTSNTHL